MRFALIAVFTASVQLAAAAPALTSVQDTLYKADGTRFDGLAQIEWQSFRSADGSEIPQHILSVRIISGLLRVSLVPTTNAPRPVTYTVRFNSDGKTQFVEHWAVPPSGTPVRLHAVRTQPTAGAITEDPATIDGVTGLRTELDIRPIKGSTFIASRAAVINASGALDGAIGQPEDCIRVDGTSGPCGTGGGSSSSSDLFIDGETPAGSLNGVNKMFALTKTPSLPASLHLFVNGMLQKLGVAYTLTGSTVTLTNAPGSADVLQAWYRYSTPGLESLQMRESETPAGLIDGTNANFSLVSAPAPASSLQLYRNGLLQKVGLDYDVAGTAVTFRPVSVPQPGDLLQATYRY